ncbi:MAG: type II secretion system F family protein [Verrucomicrobiota bacterium]
MLPITTPGKLSRQAEFYRQLSSLTSAGLGIVAGLQHVQHNPPSAELGQMALVTLQEIAHGRTFADSLEKTGGVVPAFDLALIRAGELSGRLDQCLHLLADYYDDRARLVKQVISELAYPAALFHFAILSFPFPDLFVTGNVWVYAFKTLGVLLPVYGAVLALIYVMQGRHGDAWRARIEQILHRVPLLGKARKNLALARLAAALEALISAGLPIFKAWDIAVDACGSPALRRAVHSWKPAWASGLTPAQTVQASPEFGDLFKRLYLSGEVSGKLDHELRHLHTLYQEDGTRQLHQVVQWLPRLVYFGIMLFIAYRVISFYQGYFNQINELTK